MVGGWEEAWPALGDIHSMAPWMTHCAQVLVGTWPGGLCPAINFSLISCHLGSLFTLGSLVQREQNLPCLRTEPGCSESGTRWREGWWLGTSSGGDPVPGSPPLGWRRRCGQAAGQCLCSGVYMVRYWSSWKILPYRQHAEVGRADIPKHTPPRTVQEGS